MGVLKHKWNTEIRVYVSEAPPYQLPVLLTMRVFSLEHIRQRLESDQLHFVSKKKRSLSK
jgi:hypothetical protein